MKMKTTSIGMVLLLTIGVITAVSFSLGCTEQEETPVEPSDNTSAEPVENTPAEPAENTSVEPAENISAEPIENTPAESAESTPVESAGSAGSTTEELEPVSADNITSIEWQWASFQDSDSPETQITVPDPENYTLAFFDDGTYYIKADCNSGSGTYVLEGNNLTLGPVTITLMACGPESMDGEYLSLLPTVEAVALEDGQLVLYPGNEGDKMFFTNGGEAEQ
ncbi:META domain-containing protein [Methanosarcina sp. DH2]|uniref:META domain-containing protein n=1 Tax=Methanosarcina sp. DH2 TaxID=2605639 RepID=UPI001E4BA3A2|nr:META domain-containing protein [Methanosarcina sp. DH2]MCC4769434.1 META domain-containing protein [Methanosarcina sp. DH2]